MADDGGPVDPLSGWPLLGIVIAATFCGLVLLMLIVLMILLLCRQSGCLRRGKLKVHTAKLGDTGSGLLAKQGQSLSDVELQKLGKLSNGHAPVEPTDNKAKDWKEDRVPLMTSDLPSPPDPADKSLGENADRNSWTTRNTSFRLAYEEKVKIVEKLKQPNGQARVARASQPPLQSSTTSDEGRMKVTNHDHRPSLSRASLSSSETPRQSMPSPVGTIDSPSGSITRLLESPSGTSVASSPNTVIFRPTMISMAFGAAPPKIEPLEREPRPRRSPSVEKVPARNYRPVPIPETEEPTPKISEENTETTEKPVPEKTTQAPARPNKLKIPPPTLPKPKFKPKPPQQDSNSHYDVPRVHPSRIPTTPSGGTYTPSPMVTGAYTASPVVSGINTPSPVVTGRPYSGARHSISSTPTQSPITTPGGSVKLAPWDRYPGQSSSRSNKLRFVPGYVPEEMADQRPKQRSMSLQDPQRRTSFTAHNPNIRVTISEDSPSPLYNYQTPGQPKKVATVKPNSSIKHSSYQSFREHLQMPYGTAEQSHGQIRVSPPTVTNIAEEKARLSRETNGGNTTHRPAQ